MRPTNLKKGHICFFSCEKSKPGPTLPSPQTRQTWRQSWTSPRRQSCWRRRRRRPRPTRSPRRAPCSCTCWQMRRSWRWWPTGWRPRICFFWNGEMMRAFQWRNDADVSRLLRLGIESDPLDRRVDRCRHVDRLPLDRRVVVTGLWDLWFLYKRDAKWISTHLMCSFCILITMMSVTKLYLV